VEPNFGAGQIKSIQPLEIDRYKILSHQLLKSQRFSLDSFSINTGSQNQHG